MKFPPVAIVPGILSPRQCADLIAAFESGSATPGGVMRFVDGAARNVVNENTKVRSDVKIDVRSQRYAELRGFLLAKCRREAVKRYSVRIAHTDRMLISRYDVGGFFAPHRDNNAEFVAFRELAVSVNLNVGEYDGGSLRFPEYGDAEYGPPTGGALIFPANVLHEVVPVTRGTRYVLLTFLYSEANERLRASAFRSRLCA